VANVSSIATKITANADAFNKVIDDAQKRLDKLQDATQIKEKTAKAVIEPPHVSIQQKQMTWTNDVVKSAQKQADTAQQYNSVTKSILGVTSALKGMSDATGATKVLNTTATAASAAMQGLLQHSGIGNEVVSSFKGVTDAIGNMASAGKSAGGTLGGTFGLIKAGAVGVIGVIGAVVVAITALATAGVSQAMEFRRNSIQVGETMDRYASFAVAMKLMGKTAEDATASLQALHNSMNEAKGGDILKKNAFDALKIDPSVLKSPVDAFTKIAEQTNKIGDSTARAFVAQSLFGDKAAAVLPLLGMQKDQLNGILGTAERLGQTFKNTQEVEAANYKFRELKEMLIGVGQQLATAVMPAIIAVFKVIQKIVGDGTGLGKVFQALGKIVITVVYAISETFAAVQKVIEYIKIAANKVAELFFRLVRAIVSGAKYLSDALGDISPFGSMEETLADLNKQVDSFKNNQAESNANIESINNARLSYEEMKKSINDAAVEMQNLTSTFHQNDAAIAQLANNQRLLEKARQVVHENTTPLETFWSEIDALKQLQPLVNAGVLSWEKYAMALDKVVQRLEEANGLSLQPPSALREGSSEAAGAEARSTIEQKVRSENPTARIERLLEQAKATQDRIAVYTQQTAQALLNKPQVKLPG